MTNLPVGLMYQAQSPEMEHRSLEGFRLHTAAEQVLGRRLEPGTPNIWFDDLGACVAGWTKAAGRVVQVAAASAGQDPACDAGAPAQIMLRSGRS